MERNLKEDLAKLADAFFENIIYDDSCEFGSVGTDCKRPFGNSYVEGDILEILCWAADGDDEDFTDSQLDYANDLYCKKLVPYLKEEWERLHAKTTIAATVPDSNEFKVGDVVQLRSGGIAMTVENIVTNAIRPFLTCVWIGDGGKLHTGNFFKGVDPSKSLRVYMQ
jgi:uncharacterized protein YodC (DUF2158 family)